MTIRTFTRTSLLCGCVFLTSCAYMQTHKNIEESFKRHPGYQITSSIDLYKSGNSYYIGVDKELMKVRYPVIHDSIFLKDNNEARLIKQGKRYGKVYKNISAGTAEVLQRTDGYVELTVLSDEIRASEGTWLESLPAGTSRCTTRAEITGKEITWLDTENTPPTSIPVKAISLADQVLIDWPGTVLYNVAIPIMAPFVFFHNFLSEQ